MKSKLFDQTLYFIRHLWGHIRTTKDIERDELTV